MAKLPITNSIDIYQLIRNGDTESYSEDPIYQAKNACISPTGTDIQTSEGGVASFQLFECFIYDVTVRINNADKIVTLEGEEYIVAGKAYVINNQYLHYIRVLLRQVV